MRHAQHCIKFKKIERLTPCIDFNTENRIEPTLESHTDLVKLMHNAVSGKTIEQVRAHAYVELVSNAKRRDTCLC